MDRTLRPRWSLRRAVPLAIAALAAAAITVQAAPPGLTPVTSANTKSAGITSPNVLSVELIETAVAQGSIPLENPTATIGYYGYLSNGSLVPGPNSVQSAGPQRRGVQDRARQEHVPGPRPPARPGRRLRLRPPLPVPGPRDRRRATSPASTSMPTARTGSRSSQSTDVDGNPLPVVRRLDVGPVRRRPAVHRRARHRPAASGQPRSASPRRSSTSSGALGRGGYEGIQNDSAGNLWIVEDVGGVGRQPADPASRSSRTASCIASCPIDPSDLTPAASSRRCRSTRAATATRSSFHAGRPRRRHPVAGPQDLHTYGNVLRRRTWVTIHDTATDGTAPFDANALAKAAAATPFKRPENGVFRPGTDFRSSSSPRPATPTSLPRPAPLRWLRRGVPAHARQPGVEHRPLSLLYLGDVAHTGLDNIALLDARPRRGRRGRRRRRCTGSATRSTRGTCSTPTETTAAGSAGPVPGRGPRPVGDDRLGPVGRAGFQNEGDNEITGIHVSDGDPIRGRHPGLERPEVVPVRRYDRHSQDEDLGWRVFWTQQHRRQRDLQVDSLDEPLLTATPRCFAQAVPGTDAADYPVSGRRLARSASSSTRVVHVSAANRSRRTRSLVMSHSLDVSVAVAATISSDNGATRQRGRWRTTSQARPPAKPSAPRNQEHQPDGPGERHPLDDDADGQEIHTQ